MLLLGGCRCCSLIFSVQVVHAGGGLSVLLFCAIKGETTVSTVSVPLSVDGGSVRWLRLAREYIQLVLACHL